MTGPAVRGWCPGARRPMASLDGLLMRLRIAGGVLSASLALAIADAVEQAGGGGLELSGRANLQIPGLSDAGWQQMLAALAPFGIIDDDERAEAMRNILTSPLAGWDETAVRPVGDDVVALSQALTSLSASHRLPAKFAWIIEDGGALSLADIAADLRFRATAGGWLLGAARPDGVAWFAGSADPAQMAARLVPLLPGRVRQISDSDLAALLSLASIPAPAEAGRLLPGYQRIGGCDLLSVALPFGALTSAALRFLARLARDHGAGELRLTPWRQIVLPSITRLPSGIDWAALGLLIQDDPLLSYFACRGAGYCPQAQGEVRSLARHLAAINPLPGRRLHLSACAKGCAHSAQADLTLVAGEQDFAVIRQGRAGDVPQMRATAAQLLERSFWEAMAQDEQGI